LLRFVRTADDLNRDTGFQPVPAAPENQKLPTVEHTSHGLKGRVTPTLSAILLLEGGDAIRTPDDLPEWFDAGLRIVGLAWKQTRYAGGTGAPGPLTSEGKALVKHLDRFGIIHDTSHLAEQSFWDLMDLADRAVIASHSNCRAIVGDGDRHLTDDMIRAITSRGGVIGINFYDKFLLPRTEHGLRRATLTDVVNHVKHICDLAGSAKHVGIGTDMDGGLGREQIPVEITTSADLPRVAEALNSAAFSDQDVIGIMGENWRRFFANALPRRPS
jgi:membrane dipeptidase